MDVRIGGKWTFIMHAPDGTDFDNDHTYLEIVENEKIVLQNNGHQKFEIIVELSANETQTEVTWKVVFDSVPTMEEAIKAFKADIGLTQNLERFYNYTNQLK